MWDDIITDDQNRPACIIRAENAKTGTTRVAALVEPAVYEHLTRRRDEVGGAYVVGAPLNPDTEWDRYNAQKALKAFYKCTWLATAECLCWRPTAPTSGEPPSTPCTART